MDTHRILVAWHQLYLVPFDTSPQFVGDGAGTLVAVATEPGHLIVRTGCATGPVRVSLTAHPAPPESAPERAPGGAAGGSSGDAAGGDGSWEAVEEVSLPITTPLFWSSPDPGFDLPRDPAFTPDTPGPHRVRVSARGRNRAFDEAITEPVEDYLIQVWPEPDLRSPEVLRSDQAPF